MLGLGYPELFLIGLVALIVVGPRRLPGLLRQAGKISAQVRRAANEFRRELEMAAEDDSPVRDGSGAPERFARSGVRDERPREEMSVPGSGGTAT